MWLCSIYCLINVALIYIMHKAPNWHNLFICIIKVRFF